MFTVKSKVVENIKHKFAARNLKANLKAGALTSGLAFVLLTQLVTQLGCASFESKPKPQPTPRLSEFESDLRAVRGPLILHIFIIARPDNNPLTRDDIAFINQNKPLETLETRLTDDGKKVIFGMNIEFPLAQLQALQNRFSVTKDSGQ